jgi:hypothetical protein
MACMKPRSQESTRRLELPDATSPASVDVGADRRKLGVAVRVVGWRAE